MLSWKYSTMTEIVFEELTNQSELKVALFFLFLGICGVTVVGNVGVSLLITFNLKLQSLMYFFSW